MNGYIERLMSCGFTLKQAVDIYSDFINNFTFVELEVYVRHVEMERRKCGFNTTQTQLAAV